MQCRYPPHPANADRGRCRGAFNDTQNQAFGRHVIPHAAQRAGTDLVTGAVPRRGTKSVLSTLCVGTAGRFEVT